MRAHHEPIDGIMVHLPGTRIDQPTQPGFRILDEFESAGQANLTRSDGAERRQIGLGHRQGQTPMCHQLDSFKTKP
jgi:hypothetical protein